jgi:FlaG/FlaF family flagellin (archaellin)
LFSNFFKNSHLQEKSKESEININKAKNVTINKKPTDSDSKIKTQYADGSYSVETSYTVEERFDTIKIDLSLENDTITKVKVTPLKVDKTSKKYIEGFDSQLSAKICWQKNF